MSDPLFAYFGYGSLVNNDTLRTNYISIHPASIKGWRRVWHCREKSEADDFALLSVHPIEGNEIDGALVIDYKSNLPALDEREFNYDRIVLDKSLLSVKGDKPDLPDEIYMYVASYKDINPRANLIQSYVDAVMLGFLQMHGESGVHDFLTSTDGHSHCNRKISCDRKNPIYPRHVPIKEETARWFDDLLQQHGVIFS